MDPRRPDPAPPGSTGRPWAVLLGPLLFLATELLFEPVLGAELREAHPGASAALVRHAAATTLWIAAWWFTEALPIPATSLLPLVLFPVLGLASVPEVSRQYAHDIVFLFLGGLLLAVAMERSGLHERTAIGIVRCFGHGRRRQVLGFMVATATMSMWISNTATTLMLLPVALAVLAADEREAGRARDADFGVALLLGLAFAANIGGLGTPIGSPPNVVFQNVVRQKTGIEVGFGRWMTYGVPLILLLLPLTWTYLVRRLPRRAPSAVQLPRFGRLAREERWVLGVFSITALAWITRGDLGFARGWGAALAERGVVVRDSTVAIAAALVLFVAPGRDGRRVLDWSVAPRLPWGVLLLMGAGFAISDAFDRSGLTLWIGTHIEAVGRLPLPDGLLFVLVLATVVLVSILVTEFASNTASANILLPIVFGVAAALGAERFPPELLGVACALACTTGFAMPAGTPPNALVFGTERISIRRFVRTGLAVDALSLLLIVLWIGVLSLVR